jgi:hypothetical protein
MFILSICGNICYLKKKKKKKEEEKRSNYFFATKNLKPSIKELEFSPSVKCGSVGLSVFPTALLHFFFGKNK